MAQGAIVSSGCVGNRVYTDLKESELYVAVPGKDLEKIASELQTITAANVLLSDYHQQRRQSLATESQSAANCEQPALLQAAADNGALVIVMYQLRGD